MKRAFTILELMVVMTIIGIGFMSIAPKLAEKSVGVDPRLDFFDKLIGEHLVRSRELGRPVAFTGFKGSANIITHDGKHKEIPDTASVQEAKVDGYETKGEEYAIRVYPDGLCDHFELVLKNKAVIESLPLLMTTRYKEVTE